MPLAHGGSKFWNSCHSQFPLLVEPSAVLSTLSPFSHLSMLDTAEESSELLVGPRKK